MADHGPVRTDGDAAAVRVHTERHTVARTGPLSAYLALADRFGRDEVYLLESAAGPAKDLRYQFIGFGVLLTVSVTRSVVRIDGIPALCEAVLRRVGPLLDAVGDEMRLRSPRELWRFLRAVRASFHTEGSASEFRFGFFGYFGYDVARYIEDLPYLVRQDPELPDVYLVVSRGCMVTDLDSGQSELLLYECAASPRLDAGEIIALLAGSCHSPPAPRAEVVPDTVTQDDTDYEDYLGNVDRCLEYIAAGDIYQVQIGHELTIRSTLDPAEAYQRLRDRNASPYMYLMTVGGHTVIGASPELFVRVEDGTVTMRPIAGTLPRGEDGDAAAHRLRSDPKELAEHTMLVDLCRNDIGRICQRDTLAVPDNLVVERYSHLLHLVSTVVGQVDRDKDCFDIIAALFPAGTMTGTPKVRAMEIIEEMERSRRGLYAGALGLIDVGGYVNLALCIRTLIHHDGAYRTRASAGIVADSVSDREWAETLAKSGAAYWAVTGKELS